MNAKNRTRRLYRTLTETVEKKHSCIIRVITRRDRDGGEQITNFDKTESPSKVCMCGVSTHPRHPPVCPATPLENVQDLEVLLDSGRAEWQQPGHTPDKSKSAGSIQPEAPRAWHRSWSCASMFVWSRFLSSLNVENPTHSGPRK
jgi:hypothetical protein